MKLSAVAACLALALVALPLAAKEKVEPIVNASTKDAFVTESSKVRTQMEKGGRFEFVNKDERETVNSKLDAMTRMFDKKPSVAEMNESERIQMINDQEQINAILTRSDGDRMICKSVAPVGSHIPVKTCKSQRDIAEQQRSSRQFMNDRSMVTQQQGGGE